MKTQKVWFITGAGKGFGFEIAKAALAGGDKVVATVRNEKEALSAQFNHDGNLFVVELDVTNEAQVISGVRQAVDHFGKLDVIVNNAGYGIVTAIEEASDAEARAQYDTNVFGVLNVVRAVLPFLRKQRSGHIINTSSLFAFDALPGWSLYGSTKFAVEGISQGLAKELEPFGIKVTAIEPGLFTTNFTSKESYRISAKNIEDYKDTMVGYMKAGTDSYHGSQPGDPVKLATVVVELANAENPPLHLPIGSDAVTNYRTNAAGLDADVKKWLDISLSTDHEKKTVS
ncbi:MAG: family NAD(P)-dependent oxidoreductase [Mucilaginibacter sp.]|nr:family NAD(P)-dependent oxidoreductase [Mucilaginibacter sp.]